ncbi:hypothetical protein PS1_043205 [Malus domestica]
MIAIFWRVSLRLKRRNRRDFSAARTGSPELNGSARPAVDGSYRSDPVRTVRSGSSGPTRFVRSDPVRRSDPVYPVRRSDPVYPVRSGSVVRPSGSSGSVVRPAGSAAQNGSSGSAAQNGSYGSSD